mmetsp:Transcript_15590/g.30609  ORF Transcript_15590/g.30609 Transcript_15590/m.30609 type:complete len:223 (-) Transcript_15590:177-845(-)|eukprot:CAMPEP_0175141910 /NCGR_PEP_ID=MMETSP0087-20121206/12414_1 /TAXON_ID=136419 /ORGANISM="Unknown Unknown, Strain D1" /LENGTH=222 /DNA_ID=CAMNT_0016425471 /DNA_START=70 /DNA_END=738 /DNA_ORIENTATION=+
MRGLNLLLLITYSVFTDGKNTLVKDKELKCSACEVTVRAILKELDNVDPKATLQVGGRVGKIDDKSGRIDSRKFVKLARSETRLHEIFEDLCNHDKFNRFRATVLTKPPAPYWKFVGEKESQKTDKYAKVFTSDVLPQLKRLCSKLLDEYEDDLIAYLYDNYSENLDLRNKACHKIAKWCETSKVPKPKKVKPVLDESSAESNNADPLDNENEVHPEEKKEL